MMNLLAGNRARIRSRRRKQMPELNILLFIHIKQQNVAVTLWHGTVCRSHRTWLSPRLTWRVSGCLRICTASYSRSRKRKVSTNTFWWSATTRESIYQGICSYSPFRSGGRRLREFHSHFHAFSFLYYYSFRGFFFSFP